MTHRTSARTRKGCRRAAPLLLAAVLLAALPLPAVPGPSPAPEGAPGTAPEGGPGWGMAPFPPPVEPMTSLARRGRWGDAISLYRLQLLRTHLEAERWEEALELLRRMEGRGDGSAEGELQEIRRRISWTLEVEGASLLSRQRAAEALPLADLAVRFDPSHADAWALRGSCRHRLGSEEGAEGDYRAALSLDPRHVDALSGLSFLLGETGREGEADALWGRFLAWDPDNAAGWLLRGEGHLRARDPRGALQDLERACALGSAEGCRRRDAVRSAAAAGEGRGAP